MMQHNKNSKWFILIIGILLIANIMLLFTFFNKKEPPRGGDRGAFVRDFLQKQVGFNAQQLTQYDTLNKNFRESYRAAPDSMKMSKDEEFRQLCRTSFSDSSIERMSDLAAANQKIMELKLINHVSKIRALCTPEQLPKFDSLFYKIWIRKKK